MSVTYREINDARIVGAVRTPISRHGGFLSSVRPDDLGALVLEALVERTGVPPEEVEDIYMGCANQAGENNRNGARMSLLLAGFPEKIAGLPLFTGIAIARYRLYGIDLTINRTLVYGVLAGTLALMYFGSVATTQTIVQALTGQEEQPQSPVVVSTLVIAALTPKLVLVLLLRRSARWGMIGSQQTS
jgi:thiolase-like protein